MAVEWDGIIAADWSESIGLSKGFPFAHSRSAPASLRGVADPDSHPVDLGHNRYGETLRQTCGRIARTVGS